MKIEKNFKYKHIGIVGCRNISDTIRYKPFSERIFFRTFRNNVKMKREKYHTINFLN